MLEGLFEGLEFGFAAGVDDAEVGLDHAAAACDLGGGLKCHAFAAEVGEEDGGVGGLQQFVVHGVE